MIYTLDLLIGLYVIVTGFCAAWIALAVARLFGWHEPMFLQGSTGNLPGRIGEFVLTAMIGPRLLLKNGMHHFRQGELTPITFAITVIASGTWAAFLGILVLQAAYLSGYFMA